MECLQKNVWSTEQDITKVDSKKWQNKQMKTVQETEQCKSMFRLLEGQKGVDDGDEYGSNHG